MIIGNKVNDSVDENRRQTGLPFGVIQRSLKYTIWTRTWAEVISDALFRHKFVQESLTYTSSHDQGVEYLRVRHNQYLPAVLKADQEAVVGSPTMN